MGNVGYDVGNFRTETAYQVSWR